MNTGTWLISNADCATVLLFCAFFLTPNDDQPNAASVFAAQLL